MAFPFGLLVPSISGCFFGPDSADSADSADTNSEGCLILVPGGIDCCPLDEEVCSVGETPLLYEGFVKNPVPTDNDRIAFGLVRPERVYTYYCKAFFKRDIHLERLDREQSCQLPAGRLKQTFSVAAGARQTCFVTDSALGCRLLTAESSESPVRFSGLGTACLVSNGSEPYYDFTPARPGTTVKYRCQQVTPPAVVAWERLRYVGM